MMFDDAAQYKNRQENLIPRYLTRSSRFKVVQEAISVFINLRSLISLLDGALMTFRIFV